MNKSIAKASIVLFLGVLLSRILGFIREMVIAYNYGLSKETDAFYLAFAIPELLNKLLITGVLGAILIPTFTEMLLANKKEEMDKLNSALNNFIFLTTSIISFIIFIWAENFISIVTPSLDMETKNLATNMLKILIFSTIFFSLSGLSKSYMQTNKIFGPSAFAPVLQNSVFIILLPFLSVKWGMYSLAISYLLAVISQFIFQQYYVYKLVGKKNKRLHFYHKKIGFIVITSIPALFTLALTDLNIIIDRIISANYEEGSVSAITYANKIIQLPIGIIGASLIVALFPFIATHVQKKEYYAVKRFMDKTIRFISVFMIPISFVFIFLGEDIIKLLFEYGEFDSGATKQASGFLSIYSLSMIFSIFILLFVRVFHSFQDVRTPMKIGVIMIIVKFISSYFLGNIFGSSGLAYSSVITTIIGCALLFKGIKNKLGNDENLNLYKFFFPLVVGSCTITIITLVVKYYIFDNIIFLITIYAVLFFIFCKLKKVSEIDEVINIFYKKFRKKV